MKDMVQSKEIKKNTSIHILKFTRQPGGQSDIV